MRRLPPFALISLGLLAVACAKPETAAPAPTADLAPKVAEVATTPEAMAKTMDVPLYPGADAPQGMSTMPQTRDDGSTHYSLVLATPDSPTRVAAWYAKALGFPAKGPSVIGRTRSGHDVVVVAKPEAGRTLIRIKAIVYPNK